MRRLKAMQPLGRRKVRHTVEGHQDCGICHPQMKSGAIRSRFAARQEIANENGAPCCICGRRESACMCCDWCCRDGNECDCDSLRDDWGLWCCFECDTRRLPQKQGAQQRRRYCHIHRRMEPVPDHVLLSICVKCGSEYPDDQDLATLDALPCVDPIVHLRVTMGEMVAA